MKLTWYDEETEGEISEDVSDLRLVIDSPDGTLMCVDLVTLVLQRRMRVGSLLIRIGGYELRLDSVNP